jgi:hypothetical protein
VQGVVKLPQALIRDKRVETLFLLPASQTRDKDAVTEEGVGRVIAELRTILDWVICDSPAGAHWGRSARPAGFESKRKMLGKRRPLRVTPHQVVSCGCAYTTKVPLVRNPRCTRAFRPHEEDRRLSRPRRGMPLDG